MRIDETYGAQQAEVAVNAGDGEVVVEAVVHGAEGRPIRERPPTPPRIYLASLTDAQRSATVFAADDVSTMQGAWSNLPAPLFDARQGVKFGELTDAQREAALALVKSMTSDQGYEQVLAILAADDYLGTNSSGAGPGGQALEWTSDAYRVAIYGEPSETAQWLVQFGGHHLALHLASGTATSASPSFTGVEPLTFTYEGKEYAPMVAESKAVFELINSFTAHQATAATLAGTFDGVVVGPGEDGNFPAAEGMAYADLDAAQQAMVANIIKLWVGDGGRDLRAAHRHLHVAVSRHQDWVVRRQGRGDAELVSAHRRPTLVDRVQRGPGDRFGRTPLPHGLPR